MTRVSAAIVAFFATLISSGAFASSQEIKEASPFLDAYVESIKAEHQLMVALLSKEESRLESLQQLQATGSASWLETRQQKLTVDQQKTACETYARFSSFAAELDDLAVPDQWNQEAIGKLPFTDLMLSSKRHEGQPLDLDELSKHYRSLITEQKTSHDKVELELNSLLATDPWRSGFAIRLRVAAAELNALQTQANLLKTFRSMSDVGSNETPEFNRHLSDADLTKSICKQCEAHVKLIDHSLKTESIRHQKLVELQQQAIGSQRDIDAVDQRRKTLASTKQIQTSVMAYLQDIEGASPAFTNESEIFEVTAQADTFNTWTEIRNQFSQLEATAQHRTAQLQKEMLVEVLQRLEIAASKIPATLYGDQLSNSLMAGQQAELQNYRRKIEFAELQMQLATARLESLQRHRISNTYVVAIDENVAAETEIRLSLRAATIPLTSQTLLSGFVAPSHEANSSRKPSSIDAFRSYVGFGSYSSFPTRFGNLYSGYQAVQLVDNSYPLRLSSTNRLSLRAPNTSSSFASRGSRNSLFPKYDYGSTYLRSRSLPTFNRPYQNGILRSEYRRFQTPGQPPWLFPGSPGNFRTSTFRYNW